MNFLDLVVLLHQECDLAGSGPSTTVAQTGMAANLVEWVDQAYIDIQNRRHGHWRWLRRPFTVNTVADDDEYSFGDCTDILALAVIDRFSSWRFTDPEDPPKIYLTSAGVNTERWMIWTEWDWFKHLFRIGTQNAGASVFISTDPQDNFVIGTKPNDIYTITGDYWRAPQVMTDDAAPDTAVPEMPVQFHKLIVWEAMIHYGYQQVSAESLGRAEKYSGKLTRQLENNQFPKFKKGIPIA